MKQTIVVDNHVFLLGLDQLYREAMKEYEAGTLLGCVRQLVDELAMPVAEVPIEGYYTYSEELTEYFRLVRSLQEVGIDRQKQIAGSAAYKQLLSVFQSPIYGRHEFVDRILPRVVDPVTQALEEMSPEGWSYANLQPLCNDMVRKNQTFDLVSLAVLANDPLVLTALRESVVLYATVALGAAEEPQIVFEWAVDSLLEELAAQFVAEFQQLTGYALPPVRPQSAERFYDAYGENDIYGRCVRIGIDDRQTPEAHFHWAIGRDANYNLEHHEFWDSKIWTTDEYREKLRA